jgi:hypothetical protein
MDPHQITNSGNSRGDIASSGTLQLGCVIGSLAFSALQTYLNCGALGQGVDSSTILPFIHVRRM